MLVRARVSLMTALPVIFQNSHQNIAVRHELFNLIEKKVHLTTVVRKRGFTLQNTFACVFLAVFWQEMRIKA